MPRELPCRNDFELGVELPPQELVLNHNSINWCVLPVPPRVLKGKSQVHHFVCLERKMLVFIFFPRCVTSTLQEL